MNGATETQFELLKIKILKGASGVEIYFDVKHNDGDGEKKIHHSIEDSAFPHPDLVQAIDSLKDILIIAVGKETIHSERIIAGFKGKFKKADEYAELEKVIEDHMKGEKAKIVITGISVSGYDSNKGAIITATYTCKNGSKIAVNSPRIRFEGESYGFEEAFQEICEVIQREAYLYTFKDKQAQQSIVFEETGKQE